MKDEINNVISIKIDIKSSLNLIILFVIALTFTIFILSRADGLIQDLQLQTSTQLIERQKVINDH